MFSTDDQYHAFQRRVDRLCSLILSSSVSPEEIKKGRTNLRAHAFAEIPDRIDLYDMIYESRFERLQVQFRVAEAT